MFYIILHSFYINYRTTLYLFELHVADKFVLICSKPNSRQPITVKSDIIEV